MCAHSSTRTTSVMQGLHERLNLIWKLLIQNGSIAAVAPPSLSPSHSCSLTNSLDSESGPTLEILWKERGGVVFSKVCQKPRGLYLPRISMGGWKGAAKADTLKHRNPLLISVMTPPPSFFLFFFLLDDVFFRIGCTLSHSIICLACVMASCVKRISLCLLSLQSPFFFLLSH